MTPQLYIYHQRVVCVSSENVRYLSLHQLPISYEHEFALHKEAFRDGLCLHYGSMAPTSPVPSHPMYVFEAVHSRTYIVLVPECWPYMELLTFFAICTCAIVFVLRVWLYSYKCDVACMLFMLLAIIC